MVRAVLAVLVFFIATTIEAAVTKQFQGQGANGASAAPTHAFTNAVSLHDVGILLIQNRTDETTTITSVTDTSSNTWVAIGAYVPVDHTGGTTQRSWVYKCLDMAAGTPTVTINFSGSISSTYAAISFTGASNSAQPDAEDNVPNQASNATYATDSITPVGSGIAVSLAVTTGGSTSSGTTAGYTLETSAGASRVHIWTKSSTASVAESVSTTWGASTGWHAYMINIGPAAGGGGTGNVPAGIFLKGVGR